MPTVAEIKEANAALNAVDDEVCPYKEPDTIGGASWYGSPAQIQRSEWFKDHWAREKAALEKLDALLADELARRGVRIKADGCGCCNSPALTVYLDDQYVADRGNWYFDNLLPKDGVET